jgi:Tfp pilus assembly protein PilF
MNLSEIFEHLKKEDIDFMYGAAKTLSNLEREDLEDFGFENAISELIDILKFYKEIENEKPEFWKVIAAKNKIELWNDILETIREKLREVDVTPYNLNDKGINAQDINDEETAMKYYKQAIILDPSYRWSWYNLGNIYRNKDDNTNAVECYTKAVEIYPDYGDAWNNMGNALFDLEDLDGAFKAYENAANIQSYSNRNFPFYNMGLIYEKKGDKIKAVEYFKKAISYKEDYAKAQYNAGRVLHKMGKYLEAQKYFTLALLNDFNEYHKDIEELNINIYDLITKHLIKDMKLTINLEEDYNLDFMKDYEYLFKAKINRDYEFDPNLRSILQNPEYKENWTANFKMAKAEVMDLYINNWIIKENSNESTINNPLILGDFRIKLFVKSLDFFPGTKLSKSTTNNLISILIEQYDYFKAFIRNFKNELDSLDYDSAEKRFLSLIYLIKEENLLEDYKKEFINAIIESFNISKTKLNEIYNEYLIKLTSKIINNLITILKDDYMALKLGFFLLDCVQFFFDLKEYKSSLKCAQRAKFYFDILGYKEDLNKCNIIIKKLEKY